MAASGVSVHPDCVTAFNDLKLGKSTKWIIYRISDDSKQIVVEESSKEANYEAFREKLISARSKDKRGKEGLGPRYAVYDVQYELSKDDGMRNKIVFIAWSPDDAPTLAKMMYSTSKDALKRSLNGIAVEFQANDQDDIEEESIISKLVKGR